MPKLGKNYLVDFFPLRYFHDVATYCSVFVILT